MRLAWQLARRFRRAKQQNRFISFISLSSTFGIGLGCFVLIVLLSVMNGFERELTQRILGVVPHGEIFSFNSQGIENLNTHIQLFSNDQRVAKVEPYTPVNGMIQHRGTLKSVALTGIDVRVDDKRWSQQVSEAAWKRFAVQTDGVLLGRGIAEKLSLDVGDSIQVLVPAATESLQFSAPKNVTLKISGIMKVGGELDNQIGLMHLAAASNAVGATMPAMGLRFTLHDPFAANGVMREIGYQFPQAVYMSDWTRTQGHLYNDIQLVRVVVYIALTLVIAVACFNIVSSLVMAVREKQQAIAILKTMGATDSLIAQAFILQGAINGVIGTTVGVVLGVIVAPNLSNIVVALESALGVEVLSGDIYFIDFLPSQLAWSDVVITAGVALLLSVLATLYPAKKAASLNPATALN
ncbi:lipoprotein-releasing ABC transporter permease subunit [Alteromonas sp. KUL49]|uniref:lipoprotein-releasing ABC transporter permease subunit n=1 Tax=Alteromonas sp. KUL49 TaxID=2480798 RepID=UPI00102F22FA|nr:lipoprotein-releasing ABC transporter permease subunit [Alteromonas sp. KUL49]TAP40162.1 lipoprotein-releasing ABC transporter permease subunit [Alteromonas sp. KUL49]GEA11280.1 lipoprotein transporter subunit LolE [Alteromonas sp. KUL49]